MTLVPPIAPLLLFFFFFFNDPATTEIYPLSPTRRSSDLAAKRGSADDPGPPRSERCRPNGGGRQRSCARSGRSEEHTSELQSQSNLVCRLLLEKKKKIPSELSAVISVQLMYRCRPL